MPPPHGIPCLAKGMQRHGIDPQKAHQTAQRLRPRTQQSLCQRASVPQTGQVGPVPSMRWLVDKGASPNASFVAEAWEVSRTALAIVCRTKCPFCGCRFYRQNRRQRIRTGDLFGDQDPACGGPCRPNDKLQINTMDDPPTQLSTTHECST